MQTACARALEVLVGAPLDDGDVDARQRQLGANISPVGPPPAITTACFVMADGCCGMTRGLPQAPVSDISCKWRGTGVALLFSSRW